MRRTHAHAVHDLPWPSWLALTSRAPIFVVVRCRVCAFVVCAAVATQGEHCALYSTGAKKRWYIHSLCDKVGFGVWLRLGDGKVTPRRPVKLFEETQFRIGRTVIEVKATNIPASLQRGSKTPRTTRRPTIVPIEHALEEIHQVISDDDLMNRYASLGDFVRRSAPSSASGRRVGGLSVPVGWVGCVVVGGWAGGVVEWVCGPHDVLRVAASRRCSPGTWCKPLKERKSPAAQPTRQNQMDRTTPPLARKRYRCGLRFN